MPVSTSIGRPSMVNGLNCQPLSAAAIFAVWFADARMTRMCLTPPSLPTMTRTGAEVNFGAAGVGSTREMTCSGVA